MKYSLAVKEIATKMRQLEKIFDKDEKNVIMFDIFLPYKTDENKIKSFRHHLTFISEICAWTKSPTEKFNTANVRKYWTKYDTSGDFYEKLAENYIHQANLELSGEGKVIENMKPRIKVWIWKTTDKGGLPQPKWMK